MNLVAIANLMWVGGLVVLLLAVWTARRARRGGSSFQAGVLGAMYEWQNRDKQQAVQIIVNEKTLKRRPEHPDEPPGDAER
jgi:hypothetical protein